MLHVEFSLTGSFAASATTSHMAGASLVPRAGASACPARATLRACLCAVMPVNACMSALVW